MSDESMINLEQALFNEISQMIEQGQQTMAAQVNNTAIVTFWRVGKKINEVILQNRRAEYGKQIVSTLSTQLSWSHFVELLPLQKEEARLYYAKDAAEQTGASVISVQRAMKKLAEKGKIARKAGKRYGYWEILE